jgi:hypothetical protein
VFVRLNRTTIKLDLYQAKPNYASPQMSTFTNLGSLGPAVFDPNLCNYARSCIPQPGTANKVDALSDRLLQRLAYRNFGGTPPRQELVVVHDVDINGADLAAVRWYELRKTTGTWSIVRQGTYGPQFPGVVVHRWDGSGAIDKAGDIAIGYSAGGAATPPSIRFAGRVPGDPVGQLQGETIMKAGGGSQVGGPVFPAPNDRWGDYATLSVDPANGCTFWFVGEYYAANSDYRWRTRIGSFKFPSCG